MRHIILFPVLFLLIVAAALGLRATSALQSAASPLPPAGTGYWHTSGDAIFDARNRPVRIAAVTWYGMESSYWVPAGLDYQRYTRIMDEVKALGYNMIRLPFSNELVESNPVVTQKIAANAQLRGVHAMTVMDDIVKYAQKIGLKILLDDHRSRAARPQYVNILDEPLWYTRQYPESAWIRDWVRLARRYKGNSAVIGFDLRNEPHTAGPGPWNLHAYLHQGATWGPFAGVDNLASDWRLAAERGGDAALAVNPNLLMFVQGVQLYPDATAPGGAESYFWSGILSPVKSYPVVFKVPHRLVYEAHDWGPWKWEMPWYRGMSYASVTKVWQQHWTFLVGNPGAGYAAPVWLGEFGTCTNNLQCVDLQRPDNQATWFHYLLAYLRQHRQVGWGFYALNGTNSNDSIADNGLLNPRWSGVSNRALQADLQSIQH